MAIESRITIFLNQRKWAIPVLFGLMCFYFICTIVLCEIRHLANLEPTFAFSIGAELCAMVVSIMLALSILPSYKRQSGYVRIFVTLLTIGCSCCFLDSFQMIVDGIPEFAMLNKTLSILLFAGESIFVFFFWLFVTYALKSEGKLTATLNIVLSIIFLVFFLLPFVNFFYPLYFTISDAGIYARNHNFWWLCRVFIVSVGIAVILLIIFTKAPIKNKIIIIFFMFFPFLMVGIGGYKYGISLLYTSMLVSLVMMYSFLFSDNEKILYSTNKELGLATNIQKHMLPSIFPAFPERKEFDIYALMEPAKEVGGDFYDFFLIDDNHLGLVMADVSDKGVPAALFMMASKIMVQNYALLGFSPKEVLSRVNQQICSNNQNEMFVTVWLGVLDLKTGIITASNAGHEKPILKKPNGDFEALKDKHGPIVGWFKDAKYSEYQIQLEKGSKLFLYTDGVPEATGSSGQFGMTRAVETLNKYKNIQVEKICQNTLSDIYHFMNGSSQFDDITMLCLEYRGVDSNEKTIVVKADVAHIHDGIDPILEELTKVGADHKLVYKIEVALDEVLTNVASYAYAPNEGNVTIKYEVIDSPEKMITISVIDEGVEFNPLEAKEPDITAPIEERTVGGLGLFIVKKTMDSVDYNRRNNQNILVMKKKI